MKEFLESKCRFENYEMGIFTTSTKTAAEWARAKYCVHFIYDGKYVGLLTYGGAILNEDALPEDAANGVFFYVKEADDYRISMPDEICDALEEEQPKNNAIVRTVNGFEITS